MVSLTRQFTSNTAQPPAINNTGCDEGLQNMALLTEIFTEVNKTFGTNDLYRNAMKLTAILTTNCTMPFFRVTVSKYTPGYCANQANNTKHWYSIDDQALPSLLPIIHKVLKATRTEKKKTS